MEAQNLFANLRVNVTAEEKRHLSPVIESIEYRHKHMKDLVKDWDTQAAYLAFARGFKSKLYFLRTIPNIRHLLLPVEKTIRNKFLSAATGCHICSDKEIVLISLPNRYDELAIPIFHETAKIQFMNSSKTTSDLTVLIKKVSAQYNRRSLRKYLGFRWKTKRKNQCRFPVVTSYNWRKARVMKPS